jgi:hypothetical protein
MILSWLPGTYETGMAITDDPDNGTFPAFKEIYDLLIRLRLPTTRAMWVFPPAGPTGTPPLPIKFIAPVLADPECLQYCKALHREGFEICLHGASSGNNTREKTLAALEFLRREIAPARTFICHSKNAENLYWDSKCAPSPLLSWLVSKYVKNQCFGEVEGSNYFWGDVCRSSINYIRLFRTRQTNSLGFNPGMPYHDFRKPYVNFWFSASKGYLPKLCAAGEIDSLCKQQGAGIFYQYLHKYVSGDGTIDPQVRECLERIAGDRRVLFLPVSRLLDRLRQARMVFMLSHQGKTFLINASDKPFDSAQIILDVQETVRPAGDNGPIRIEARRAVIQTIPGLSVFDLPVENIASRTTLQKAKMHSDIAEIRFPLGAVVANCSSQSIEVPSFFPGLGRAYPTLRRLGPHEVRVFYAHDEAKRLEILMPLPPSEHYKLFIGQAKLLLREHLFLGRKISISAYLKDTGKVENQANW